jgi:exodeoxyribonuclease VII large subunit
MIRALAAKHDALDNFAGRLTTHSERHESLLARGYVVVRDAAEKVVTDAIKVRPNTALELEFYDGKVGAIAGGSRRPVKRTVPPIGQGDLFKEP